MGKKIKFKKVLNIAILTVIVPLPAFEEPFNMSWRVNGLPDTTYKKTADNKTNQMQSTTVVSLQQN